MDARLKGIAGFFIVGVAMFFLSCIVLETAAEARAGGGRSMGSRGFSSGSRSSGGSYNRSTPYNTTNPTRQQAPNPQQPNPYSPRRSFLYGLGGGLMGGMIGNMLFGRSGYGGMGGYGGGGFGFGDIIILLIIAGIIYFVYKRYKATRQMQMSGVSPAGYGSYTYNEPAYDVSYTPQPALGSASDGIRHIAALDPAFNEQSFRDTSEDLFFKIQGGWTRRDISGIAGLLTPQMRDIFQGDISRYLEEKKVNRLENIAVRQVEIVDAVQDEGEEFITVRYTASLLDFTTDEAGTVLSGSPTEPVKFLEYWTYARKVGERDWRLAAITQEQDHR